MDSEHTTIREASSLSIVLPVFNEEGNIEVLYQELTDICASLKIPFELIFVDDGSRDGSPRKIVDLARKDLRVRALLLSRNFGHQSALMAGMEAANGEIIITMDSDLQHPPALIPILISRWNEGADIVHARRERVRGNPLKQLSSLLFYQLVNKLSDVPVPEGVADFRLYGRPALDALLSLRERDRFNRGLVSWIGFRTDTVNYTEAPRRSGRSKYNFFRMLSLALSGVTSLSGKPLRIAFLLGLLLSLIGLAYAIYAIVQHLLGYTVAGWTSTLLSILIIGGVQLISTGIIGEYLARLFNEVKGRPHYIIRESIGKDDYLCEYNQVEKH
jgi:polyisoprenyl-phosphate glycosyltransferase